MDFTDLKSFHYDLPERLIRKTGVEPRDSARLFVYDTKKEAVFHDTVKNIGRYLPNKALLVFNETKVLPARLWLTKETGGKIEVFILANEQKKGERFIPALVDRKVKVGERLFYGEGSYFQAIEQKENRFYLQLCDGKKQSLEQVLFAYGQTPLPPYIKGNTEPENVLRQRYQSVLAKTGTSVAAPTASLHFTESLLKKLEKNGIDLLKISLEVGLGTFAPLREENFTTRTLHTEYATYTKDFLTELEKQRKKKPIIPVGTTALRALETLAVKSIERPGTFATDIFITPGFSFRNTDGLITNFHTPRSSLMLLVEAFLQHQGAKRGILDLYKEAIEKEYAFYSFGDCMLIL